MSGAIAPSGSIELIAPHDGLFGFLFTNAGASGGAVELQVEVRGHSKIAWIDPAG